MLEPSVRKSAVFANRSRQSRTEGFVQKHSLINFVDSKNQQFMLIPQKVIRKTVVDSGLVENPMLASHLRFHAIDDKQVFLFSEAFTTLLHGNIYPLLLPLLDGSHSCREIVVCLADWHDELSVTSVLASLASKGYIHSAEHGMEDGLAAFWTSLGVSPRLAEERMAAFCVSVTDDAGIIAQRLRTMGVSLCEDDAKPSLSIIVCKDYLEQRHAEVNRIHIASGIPWLLVKPGGQQPMFGPVFRPADKGPCWSCLAYRLRGHQEVHNFLRNLTAGDVDLTTRINSPNLDAVLGFVAVEIVKWVVLGEAAPIHNHAFTMDVADLSIERHRIMRRPQCFECGDELLYNTDRSPVPLRLQPSPKVISNSGGVRSVSPETTLSKYRHLIGPVGGVVTWLKRTTSDSDSWLNVHWAGSNLALKNRSLSVLRLSLRTKSAGKGSTSRQSEASALCEALERYCGAFHGDEIRCKKRYLDFASSDSEPDAIHPNDVQLFSELQLDDANRINASGHPYNVVPPRLDPTIKVDWSPVWSLTRDRPKYLPTSLLYYGKSADHRGVTDFVADSNGCAAGNTLEEAILQGFFELVERDAFAVWWYNRLSMPGVDLESFDDQYLAEASGYYRRLNRDLCVLDITSDFGIPTFVAISRRTDKKQEDIIYGAGSHFDPLIAAFRAVCELNQFLNWVQGTGPGGAGYRVDDPQCLWWWQNATLENQPYLAPAAETAMRRRTSYDVPQTTDLRDDVEKCRALVESKGMEFLVLNQTRPDIGMPVVRVIVPGMRHYWQRFAPGRLFDVPVEMEWCDTRLCEAEVNPAPVIG